MFATRAREKELIDLGPDFYSHDEYIDCLKKLFRVNVFLGVFRDTVKTLKSFRSATSLLDIGCGGGRFILSLSRYFPLMAMHGADVSPVAILHAQQSLLAWKVKYPQTSVSFELQQQAVLDLPKDSVDIILITLVCHHLSDEELVIFLRQAYHAATKAVVINDLHRNRIAYALYRIVSPILFRNRLISHDGLISIRRGFVRSEWKSLLRQAGIVNYQLKWRFPFRWQLVLRK